MVTLESTRGSWGTVRDDETDERYEVGSDVDRDVAERLVEAFDPLYIEEDTDDDSDADTDEIDELLDGTVEDVRDALESGDYDDRLDEIEDRADRQGVVDAADDRREG